MGMGVFLLGFAMGCEEQDGNESTQDINRQNDGQQNDGQQNGDEATDGNGETATENEDDARDSDSLESPPLTCKTLAPPCEESCLAKADTCGTEAACTALNEACLMSDRVQALLDDCEQEHEACRSDPEWEPESCDMMRKECRSLATQGCEKTPDECALYCATYVVDDCQVAAMWEVEYYCQGESDEACASVTASKNLEFEACLETLGTCYDETADAQDINAPFSCNEAAIVCFDEVIGIYGPEDECAIPPFTLVD